MDANRDIERLILLYGNPNKMPWVDKPLYRAKIYALALHWDSIVPSENSRDHWKINKLIRDNSEYKALALFQMKDSLSIAENVPIEPRKPFVSRILSNFYQSSAHFYAIDRPDYTIRINPLLNLNAGIMLSNEPMTFANQRGMELRASIDKKFFIYANILESQSGFPTYVDQYESDFQTLPGTAFYKTYNSSGGRLSGYDYLSGEGSIAFKVSKNIGITFGNRRNFIGDGYRSLLLSDFASNYVNLKIDWSLGPFHYQNIFAELNAGSNRSNGANNAIIPKKYLAAHHLNYSPNSWFRIGIFENVTFARANHFEFNYLNPFIFYRSIEGAIGSPDNVQLGLDGSIIPAKGLMIYGQFLVDELKVKELFGKNGWWGNKYGIQLGLKYKNAFGLKQLNMLAEFNLVRPYTYSHYDSIANYSHQNQALAHPLGANFKELLLKLQYQISPRLSVEGNIFYFIKGEDADSSNFGGNILLPNSSHISDFGINILQGNRSETILGRIDLSYEWFHQFYIEAQWIYRVKSYQNESNEQMTNSIKLGIRWNLPKTRFDF